MLLIYIAYNELLPQNLYTGIIIHASLFGMAIVCIVFCFKINFLSALFCGIGAFATQHWAFKFGCFFQIVFQEYSVPIISHIIYILCTGTIYITAYFIFGRRLRQGVVNNINNISVMLLSIGLFIIIMQIILSEYKNPIDSTIVFILTVYGILCCIFTLCIQYDIFKSGKMQEEHEILKHLLHQQKEHMKISKSNIELINIKCHDLKHQLSRFKEKLTNEEIKELEKMVFIYNSVLYTGNESLDVILTEKRLFFEKNQIKLDCIVDGKSLDFMNPSDIYSLFGNALDNAFEAVKSIEDTDKRMIGINIKKLKECYQSIFKIIIMER